MRSYYNYNFLRMKYAKWRADMQAQQPKRSLISVLQTASLALEFAPHRGLRLSLESLSFSALISIAEISHSCADGNIHAIFFSIRFTVIPDTIFDVPFHSVHRISSVHEPNSHFQSRCQRKLSAKTDENEKTRRSWETTVSYWLMSHSLSSTR